MRSADVAWIALAVGVVTYDVLAHPGETLSEGADRYMLTHPWTTRAVALAVSGHVCNLLPGRYDPIHLFFKALRGTK